MSFINKIRLTSLFVVFAISLSCFTAQSQLLSNRKQGTVLEQLEQNSRNNIIDQVIKYAYGFRGTPYRYGAMSPRGFDCSGFTLDCSYNYLGSLNLTDCKQLKKFTSYNNNLAELDLDGCYQIEEIYCTGSQMTIFSITGKEKLKTLYLNDNYSLKWLYCNSNALTQLSFTYRGINPKWFMVALKAP